MIYCWFTCFFTLSHQKKKIQFEKKIWIKCLIDVSMGWPGWPGGPEGWPKPPSRPPWPPRQCSWPPHPKTHEKPPFGPPSARQATPIPLATLLTTPGRSHPSCHPSHPLGQPSTMIVNGAKSVIQVRGGREWKRRGEEGSEGKRGEGRKDRRGRGVRKEYTKNKDSWWYWPFFVILMEV